MSLRVILLGQLPAPLAAQLPSLLSSLDLTLVATVADPAGARAALSAVPAPDLAIAAAPPADGGTFPLLLGLPAAARPAALVIVGTREADAVVAFEAQATDFVLWPAEPARVEQAVARARQVALQRALLRTADELQRLISEATALGVVEPVGRASGTDAAGRRRPFGGSANGTLVATAPWRTGQRSPAGTDDSVLDLSREDGGRAGQGTPPLRVLVREGRRTRFVPLAEVDWFEADGNYIRVHAAGEAYRTRGTITAIENVLDPRQFVRIHRRIVVNMDRVREMTPLPGGDGLLLLGDGSTLRLSRTYRSRVR